MPTFVQFFIQFGNLAKAIKNLLIFILLLILYNYSTKISMKRPYLNEDADSLAIAFLACYQHKFVVQLF